MALSSDQIAEARRLYTESMQTPSRIARRLRAMGDKTVTGEQVRAVLVLKPHGKPIPADLRRRVLELAERGMRPVEIVEKLGANGRTVRSIMYAGAIEARGATTKEQRLSARALRNRRYRAIQRAANPIPFPEPVEIDVPAWVPGRLFEFYEHRARVAGEEVAASECRKLKQGASLAHL